MIKPELLNDQVLVILLSTVPGLPLATGLGLLIPALRSGCLKIAPWTAFIGLAASLLIHSGINLEVPWFFMGGRIGLDVTGRAFLLFSSLIWLLSALFARPYLAGSDRKEKNHLFYFYFLVSMSGNFGLILAREVLGFYLFFGLMSFAAYGLIIHERSPAAMRAGRVYIILVILGEVLLFSAFLLLAAQTGSLRLGEPGTVTASNISLLLFFLGFGIKAGALPLHVWLPLAHPAAPAPASAVLSGAMIKAGLLGWLRFLPLGQADTIPGWWGQLFLLFGLLAAFYGIFIGLSQSNPKTILAYSSISQMGLMTTIVGCGLLVNGDRSVIVAVISFYALHHGLAKATLFLAVGVVRPPGKHHSPPQWFWFALALPCLALAGMPGTGGFAAKQGFKELLHLSSPSTAKLLAVALPLAAGGTAMLLTHFFLSIKKLAHTPPDRIDSICGWWVISLIISISLPWLRAVTSPWLDFIPSVDHMGSSMLPIVLGMGFGLFYSLKLHGKNGYHIPAGDMLELLVLLRMPWPFSYSKSTAKPPNKAWRRVLEYQATVRTNIFMHLQHYENLLKRWAVIGSCYVLLCLILLLMLQSH